MTDPHHRPPKPPKPPGISSSNASVIPIGFALNIEQSDKVIEQTASLNQNIPILGQRLIVAKSNVTVYFGNLVGSVTVTPTSITLSVGADQVISAVAKDSLGAPISGRPMVAASTNTQVCTVISTSGTSAAFSITLHPLSAGNCQINVTCDGVIGICSVTVSAIVVIGTWLFEDTFVGGVKAGAQNGISWGAVTDSDPTQGSNVQVRADPGSPSGYALAFDFIATTLVPRQDANIDQRFRLPDMFGIYIEFVVYCDLNYERRTNSPNNHKLIRVWDDRYGQVLGGDGSRVHLGASSDAGAPLSGTSISDHGNLVMEYEWSNGTTGQMGPHGKGPYTPIFSAGRQVKIGMYIRPESAYMAQNGIEQAWVDGVQVLNNTGIRTWLNTTNPNAVNAFRNGHIMGTANYGWSKETIMYVRSFKIASAYPY